MLYKQKNFNEFQKRDGFQSGASTVDFVGHAQFVGWNINLT